MYLMDQIAEIAKEVADRKEYSHPIVGIYPALYHELQGCPRFIFDERAIETATEITLGRPKIILDSILNLRIPYPKLWVEWPESGRGRLREVFQSHEEILPERPLPTKLGFYLKTDEFGRKGVIQWVWNSPANVTDMLIPNRPGFNPPNIAPISPYFNLDKEVPQNAALLTTFIKANLCALWEGNKIQQDAIFRIWRTSDHQPSSPWGVRYLKYVYGGDNNKDDLFYAMNHFYADVYGEYIMVWACLLLLTSSKKIIEETKIDLSGLNKARIKKQQVPKLDYTRVNLYINPEAHHIKFIRGPLGHTRKSPRIHMVSSFLNRRGNKHWVVQPFWRGEGEVISRHVHVKEKEKDK